MIVGEGFLYAIGFRPNVFGDQPPVQPNDSEVNNNYGKQQQKEEEKILFCKDEFRK
jgi:hypothetical protein